MKIIGLAGRDVFLVEARKDELNQICTGTMYDRVDLSVGCTIQVNKIFGRLHKLAANKGNLTNMAENLRAMATLLESTEPIVRDLVEEEPEVVA